MARPEAGDTVYVGRHPDGRVSEAFRRTPDGSLSDITGEVGSVESSAESFTITGKPPLPGVEPWNATCDRDAEASDAMLRGVVRVEVGLTDWAEQACSRIKANMRRYGLTPRQCETAWLLFSDWTGTEIADELYLSEQTVKNHVGAIIQKLGLNEGHQNKAHRTPIILRLLDLEGLTDA